MKPLKLTVEAFGPYMGTQTIDFTKLGQYGLFLIHGRTGSGKSTILDALCFALFGDTTGGERGGSDFVSTFEPGALTRVTLEFEHLGSLYRVTRTPTQERAKIRGDGFTVQQADATLERLGPGEGKVVASKVGDVTRSVQDMLRCNVEQFRQTVVLPQGDFRKVVTDHKSRLEILSNIFRTERFAEVAERLKNLARDLAQMGRSLQEERTRIFRDLDVDNEVELKKVFGDAVEHEASARAHKEEAAGRRDAALRAKHDGEALAREFDELQRLKERLGELDERSEVIAVLRQEVERAQRAARLLGDRRHLDAKAQEHADLEEKIRAATEALASATAQLEGAEAHKQEIERERPDYERAQEQFNRLEALRPQIEGLAEKRTQREALSGRLEKARADLQAAAQSLAEIGPKVEALTSERKSLLPLVERELAASEVQARSLADLDAARRIADIRRRLDELREELGDSLGTGDPAAHLAAAMTENASGLLAGVLEDGQPCPVCGSPDHPAPATAESIEGIEEALSRFADESARLAKLKERESNWEREIAEKCSERGWEGAPPPIDELERVAEEASAVLASVREAKERVSKIDGELERLQQERETRSNRCDELKSLVAEFEGQLTGIDGEIRGTVAGLAEEHRDPEAFTQALQQARTTLADHRSRFEEAAQRLEDAGKEHATAQMALSHHEGALETVSEALSRLKEEFAEKLQRAGFANREDFEAAVIEENQLEDKQAELKEYDDEKLDVSNNLKRCEEKLAGKERPDLAALEEALASAQANAEESENRWTEATRQLSRVQGLYERFQAIVRQDAEVAERRQAAVKLSDLANGQLTGRARIKFETFVLQSIFYEVLQVGNQHLRHMTAGRYSLVLRQDDSASATGLELDVSDNFCGGESRPVHTLSGGEGFLASLSLALALSEIAQRQSGGLELGALFIDEGFGSLDTDSLDHVVEILRSLPQEHRMVGVISHVEALKRRIPVQLLVLSEERGSRVETRFNA